MDQQTTATVVRQSIEATGHLSVRQQVQFAKGIVGLSALTSLDDVAAHLRAALPDWYVYRGGSHVALHLADRDTRRVLLVTDGAAAHDAPLTVGHYYRTLRTPRCWALGVVRVVAWDEATFNPRGDHPGCEAVRYVGADGWLGPALLLRRDQIDVDSGSATLPKGGA